MYYFYGNPPETKEDLREYLTSWLQKIENAQPVELNDDTYIQELGFRRAFHMHEVWRNMRTNEYIWWVVPDTQEFNIRDLPSKRYNSYDDLLNNVIHEYARGLKIL
jgi:hypothetical protein